MKLPLNKLRPYATEALGWILIILGILALVLPGPGLLAIFAGLALLSTRYEWAEKRVEPVKKAALQAAKDSVSSLPRIIFTLLMAFALIGLGVFWGLGPSAPSWWPLDDKFWLAGGWGAGGTLIASGMFVIALLIYSYRRYR